MGGLSINPQKNNTVNDSKLSFSPSLVSWLYEAQHYSRERWAIPKITTEALLFTFIRDSGASFNFGPKDCPSISENIIYSLEKKLKMLCDKKNSINSPLSQHFVAIENFTHNITRLAKENALDPISEREYEIRQMIDILLRRRQNNPLLVGEPGVGKTALIEGLAERNHI
jgi:ATP-dependent Clp protease ATP-binding subunit ClpA